jgi:hypothetical protein
MPEASLKAKRFLITNVGRHAVGFRYQRQTDRHWRASRRLKLILSGHASSEREEGWERFAEYGRAQLPL